MPTMIPGVLGGELKGVAGNAVFVRTSRGTVVRDRIVPHDPQTPAQIEVRARQRRAAQAWTELDLPTVALWTAWARTVGMQPNNAFASLYKVLLRLDPEAPAPLVPPARPFFGDAIAVEAGTSSPDGSFGRGVSGERLPEPPPPAPSSKTSHLEEGVHGVVFLSSGANAPLVVTELLLQPLASRHRRTYLDKYRHAAYARFAAGETVAVPAEVGWTACAYRFASAATGQVTALAELGVVRVG